jgi:tetratricopeptide (TPR) repeat protein
VNPKSADAFYNRGRVYEYEGDYTRAIPDYDQALTLKPGDADALCGRGSAYSQKGDYDRAIQDYDQALRINPAYVLALANRRLAYTRKGDYLRAMADTGRLLWLKYTFFGAAIRLCLLLISIGIAVKLIFKHREGQSTLHPG